MIKITHIKWVGRKIGIALNKLVDGDNDFVITAKNKKGNYIRPGVFTINSTDALTKYGLSVINKNNLRGIWVPLEDLQLKEKKYAKLF